MRYLLVLLLLVCSGAQSPAADAQLEKAIRAHHSGDFPTAEAGYRDFLSRNPKVYEIRSNLGAVLAAQGRYTDAIKEYQAALALAPRNSGILLNLALAHYKVGEIREAAARLDSIAEGNFQARLLLADCLLQMNENARVVKLLEPIASQKPDDLAVAYLLGTALVRDNRIPEGQKLLDRILRNGDSAEARLLLGTAHFGMGEFAEALNEFQKAVDLNPNLPSANAYLGRALMATGDTAGAAKALKHELELNPNDFEANLNLAVIVKQDQDYEASKKLLDRALLIRPGDARVLYQQATIYLAENQPERARQTLEAVLKDAPQFVEAHVTMATVYYRLKRKADGDKERAIVERLNAELQAKQPKGDTNRGDSTH